MGIGLWDGYRAITAWLFAGLIGFTVCHAPPATAQPFTDHYDDLLVAVAARVEALTGTDDKAEQKQLKALLKIQKSPTGKPSKGLAADIKNIGKVAKTLAKAFPAEFAAPASASLGGLEVGAVVTTWPDLLEDLLQAFSVTLQGLLDNALAEVGAFPPSKCTIKVEQGLDAAQTALLGALDMEDFIAAAKGLGQAFKGIAKGEKSVPKCAPSSGGGGSGGGGGPQVLHSFNSNDGKQLMARLVEGPDGWFYGTAWTGGSDDCGTIFRVSTGGQHQTLHDFGAGAAGCQPLEGLALGLDGAFYGVTALGGSGGAGVAYKMTTGGVFSVVHNFGGIGKGSAPYGRLLLGSDGDFYGTTTLGGATTFGGTFFRMTHEGAVTILHSFPNNVRPEAGVIEGADGKFYGSTRFGGSCPLCGTVFRISAAGEYELLHSFNHPSAMAVQGPLLQATDGNFYGVTDGGGSNGAGSAFRMTPAGAMTTLWNFGTGTLDQMLLTVPHGGLIQASNGHLYGTANQVFRLTTGGVFTPLYGFLDIGVNGPILPRAGVTQGSDGKLYGTSLGGGAIGNFGTVFRVNP